MVTWRDYQHDVYSTTVHLLRSTKPQWFTPQLPRYTEGGAEPLADVNQWTGHFKFGGFFSFFLHGATWAISVSCMPTSCWRQLTFIIILIFDCMSPSYQMYLYITSEGGSQKRIIFSTSRKSNTQSTSANPALCTQIRLRARWRVTSPLKSQSSPFCCHAFKH